MKKIQEVVVEKLQEQGRSTDETTIEAYIKHGLQKVCALLPRDPYGSEMKELMISKEFETLMFEVSEDNPHENAVNALVSKAMDIRNDLARYPAIRNALVAELEKQLS